MNQNQVSVSEKLCKGFSSGSCKKSPVKGEVYCNYCKGKVLIAIRKSYDNKPIFFNGPKERREEDKNDVGSNGTQYKKAKLRKHKPICLYFEQLR